MKLLNFHIFYYLFENVGHLSVHAPQAQTCKNHCFMNVENSLKNECIKIEHWIICINRYSFSPLDPNGPQIQVSIITTPIDHAEEY